jgi:hypothetical protein
VTDYRTQLAVLQPGGCRAVVAHLADVRDHADTDLLRAPIPQRLLVATLDHWADAATTTLRSELDRLPAEFAVAQFARLPAPQSVTGLRATEAARHLALLREHGWLVPAANTGGRTLYRAAVGTPFGVQPARRTR